MLRSFIVLLCALVLGLNKVQAGCNCGKKQPAQNTVSQRMDAYLQSQKDFSGAVLVTKQGRFVLVKGYGFENQENNRPNTIQTKFRIASMTKPFTAAAILMLKEKGLLNVQDPLSKFIPDYPAGDHITLHQLLTHTSGIPDYSPYFLDIAGCSDLQSLVQVFQRWPLEFEPGSQFKYSNLGYSFLAHIIEKVSGKKYETFLQEAIFKPLAMRSTGNGLSEMIKKNQAVGYVKTENGVEQAPPLLAPVTLVGNGGLVSSILDLHQWDQALFSEKILSPKSREMFFAPHVLVGPGKRAHGYGWFIDTKHNKRVIESSGALRGFLSKYTRFIDDQITVIVLSNVEDINRFTEIYDHLVALALEENK